MCLKTATAYSLQRSRSLKTKSVRAEFCCFEHLHPKKERALGHGMCASTALMLGQPDQGFPRDSLFLLLLSGPSPSRVLLERTREGPRHWCLSWRQPKNKPRHPAPECILRSFPKENLDKWEGPGASQAQTRCGKKPLNAT